MPSIIIDKNNNEIRKTGDRLELVLASEGGRVRLIGTLKGSILEVCRNKAKHLHRKMKAYGFNEYIIRNSKLITDVLLKEVDTGTEYLIPIFALRNSKNFKNFKASDDGQDYELQLFVTLQELKPYKR